MKRPKRSLENVLLRVIATTGNEYNYLQVQ